MPAPVLTAISPTDVDNAGGTKVTITGTFVLSATYSVHVGPTGNNTDPRCFGGQGSPTTVDPKNTTTLECWLPELTTGSIASVYVEDTADSMGDVLDDVLTVVEPTQSSSLFSLRAHFAPNRRVGPRNFSTFPAADPPKQLLTESGDLEAVAWTTQQLSIVATEEDPFGGVQGFIFHEDATAASVHRLVQLAALPPPALVAGQTYTLSAYVKAMARFWCALSAVDGGDSFVHNFNLQTGVVGTFLLGGGTGGVVGRLRAVDLATAWYRVEMTFRPNNTGPYDLAINIADDAGAVTFNGANQDSLRVAFPSMDTYPLARAYRESGAVPIT